MRIAYFDCSAGISGDMCLGAIVNAGVPLKKIEKGLKGLAIKGYTIEARRAKRAGIAATKVDVIVKRSRKSETRTWKDIKDIISRSSLPSHIKQKGLNIFKRLFSAEGKVHGMPSRRAHLHELGAVDCLVDIFGTLIGLELLGVKKIFSSPVNVGTGSVAGEHGLLPVPAPATAELLKNVPVYAADFPFELTTPTGAAILGETAGSFTTMPLILVRGIGYGAGQRDMKGLPNVLRIFIGDEAALRNPDDLPKVTVIETNIDDMNPQVYGHVMGRLLDSGALDVFLTQVIMKKGRPGILLTVLCDEEQRAEIMEILFRETTTIGLRFYETSRVLLDRKAKKLETEFGELRVKVSIMQDGTVKVRPEYEDCRRIAQEYKMPLLDVMKRLNTL